MKGLRGLKVVQFGLFVTLVGFSISLFSNVLFMVGSAVESFSDNFDLTMKLYRIGIAVLPVCWILAAVGKICCVGAPEETAKTNIIASILFDFGVLASGYWCFSAKSALDVILGVLGFFICILGSYIFYLKFLGRMGSNVGEPRAEEYAGILKGLIFVSSGSILVGTFARSFGILGVNLFGLFTTCLFNYTIYVIFRALPLYIEEVKRGFTDPTESAEDREAKERKARLSGGGAPAGPTKSKPPEEPKGTPPAGSKLYRIPKGLEPLHMAVKEGDRYKVDLCIAQGADPNQAVKHGLTPLHIAASVGVMDVADALLKVGVPIDATCEMGLTPLYFAIQTGNPNIVGFFLNKGANIFHSNEEGYTPLHWACSAPHPNFIGPVRKKMVTLLVSQGGDLQARTHDGKTPLDLALENELEDTVETIQKHLPSSESSVPVAAEVGLASTETSSSSEVLPSAFEPFRGLALSDLPSSLSPLHQAVKDGDPDKVERQFSGEGTVHDSMSGGIKPIHITAITGVMSVTELLLRYGAKINDTCDHQLTAIFLAVHLNNTNMVGYLISRGADLNHQDELGRTPLHWAAAAPHPKLEGHNRVKLVKFLLENGADAKMRDNSGQSALDLARAAEMEGVVKLLDPESEETTTAPGTHDDDDYYV